MKGHSIDSTSMSYGRETTVNNMEVAIGGTIVSIGGTTQCPCTCMTCTNNSFNVLSYVYFSNVVLIHYTIHTTHTLHVLYVYLGNVVIVYGLLYPIF